MSRFSKYSIRILLTCFVLVVFTGIAQAGLFDDITGAVSSVVTTGTGATGTGATSTGSTTGNTLSNPNETNPYAQLGPGGFDVRPAQPGAFTIPAYSTVEGYIVSLINFFLDFLGIIVLIMLIYGGYQYITAFGDAGKLKKSKSVIVSAMVGFVIVIIAFAIVSTIISATRRGVNECVTPQAGLCVTTSGGGVNFGVGTGIGNFVGSLF